MSKHFRYFVYLCKHKWFVFLAGLRIGVPLWRLLVHDLSKFRPREWFAYANHFYGKDSSDEALGAFSIAWNHHQKTNDHHWQYWLLTPDKPPVQYAVKIKRQAGGVVLHQVVKDPWDADVTLATAHPEMFDGDLTPGLIALRICNSLMFRPVALPMPKGAMLEMVADWAGAGRAISGKWDLPWWYSRNLDNMILHPETQRQVEAIISAHFPEVTG